jgi:predicted nucleic-acid-binding Zn-ribbon protein
LERKLVCPLCEGVTFSREEVISSGKWGGLQEFVVLVCSQCGASQFFRRPEVNTGCFDVSGYPTKKKLVNEMKKLKDEK